MKTTALFVAFAFLAGCATSGPLPPSISGTYDLVSMDGRSRTTPDSIWRWGLTVTPEGKWETSSPQTSMFTRRGTLLVSGSSDGCTALDFHFWDESWDEGEQTDMEAVSRGEFCEGELTVWEDPTSYGFRQWVAGMGVRYPVSQAHVLVFRKRG